MKKPNLRGFWKERSATPGAVKVMHQRRKKAKNPPAKPAIPSGTVIYCDGGCRPNPGPGGYGGVIVINGEMTEISGFEKSTTNNRMELTAAIRSLERIESGVVTLHTDSMYVIDGITSWINGWMRKGWVTSNKQPVLNRDLWEELHSHNIRLSVCWVWVKGHSGVQLNERADALASKAISSNSIGECTNKHFKFIDSTKDNDDVLQHWKTL